MALTKKPPPNSERLTSRTRQRRPLKAQGQRQRSGQGKKVVTYYLDPEPFMQLKVLSAKTGKPVQELNLEALNLLFERHQVSRIAS